MLDLTLPNMGFANWLAVVVASGSLLVLTQIIYNLFFHPLSRVPGPFWARASGIPSWYHAAHGKRHIWMWRQFQIHGDRVRPAPNLVLFCDPEAYADIYGMNSNVRRSQFYDALATNHLEINTLSTSSVTVHARKRKILNQCFTEKSIRASSGFIVRHVDRWNQILAGEIGNGAEWSNVVDFSEQVERLAFDIMGDLSFGKSFDLKEPGDNPFTAIPHIITEYMRFLNSTGQSPFLSLLLWLKPRGLDSLFEFLTPPATKKYNQFVADNISNRIALQRGQAEKTENEKRLDMFHFLIEAQDPETGLLALSEDELKAESSLLIIAGTDTVAIGLSGVCFYLTGDPRRCQKLVDEIRTTFESADEIVHGPKLSGCEYLRACIDEGMRLVPSGPGELPREVLPGGIRIRGEYYPPGTIVGFASWAGRRNHAVYGDPEVFRPERWIVDRSAGVTNETVARMKANYFPFASGPGNCVGQNLAMVEMTIILARTLHRFDVRRAPGSTLGGGSPELGWGARDKNQMQVEEAYISIRQGPEVQFRKRSSSPL